MAWILLMADVLRVGPGQKYASIEDAVRDAKAGDVVEVHPLEKNRPYEKVAVYVTQRNLTIRGVPPRKGERVRLSGRGFEYSGDGTTPRAIFQFNRGADGCVLEGFDLSGAHNASHNGAAVRIQDACRVTVRDCDISENDMGIMSGGTAAEQLIEHCRIRKNGDPREPGMSHNLYLGGASVTVRFCEISHSVTGHNVKSRAHVTRVEYSYVHDSANREFDLVDADETETPQSDAVLLGNVIVKAREAAGNRTVVHFGQDGGLEHDGALYLVHNTIVTPYGTPVIDLTAPKARAFVTGNIFWDAGAKAGRQILCEETTRIAGGRNWFSRGFAGLKLDGSIFGEDPGFADPARGDFRLARPAAGILDGGYPVKEVKLPASAEPPLAWQYKPPLGKEKRPSVARPALGAYQR